MVQGRKGWRNVKSVTVTFDGDKCESAAIQLLSLPLALPLSFSLKYLAAEQVMFVSRCEKSHVLKSCQLMQFIVYCCWSCTCSRYSKLLDWQHLIVILAVYCRRKITPEKHI